MEDESEEGRDTGRARERVVRVAKNTNTITEVPVFDEEKTRELMAEMLEEYRGHWLEEDELRQHELVQELCHEICTEIVAENIHHVNERVAESGALLDGLQEHLEALEREQNILRLDSAKKSEALESLIQSESKKVAAKFKHHHDAITKTFDEAAAENALTHNKFRILMKEAFENFKISIELEQTKRMR